jgi:mannose-6-phosphate isomerase-like protein (cupin superfamily)
MPLKYPLVHVDDVVPENMQKGEGWAISEFRLPITGKHGSSTTIFHSIFRPGSTHARHLHRACDEIAVYLEGNGIVGQGDERTEVRAGHCRLMPKGSEHFFHNETKDAAALVIGFYVGAGSVPGSGYEFCGPVTRDDLDRPRGPGLRAGILLPVDSVAPNQLDPKQGWRIADFRLPIGSHNGSPTSLFWARLAPGDAHEKHRFEKCETLYYVFRGTGVTGAGSDRAAVRAGHVHYVPKGVEHFIANTSTTETLEIVGLYVGAGSIEAAGYVHTGAVTAADLAARTE